MTVFRVNNVAYQKCLAARLERWHFTDNPRCYSLVDATALCSIILIGMSSLLMWTAEGLKVLWHRLRPYSIWRFWIQIHSESGFGFTGKSNGLDSWVLSKVTSLLFAYVCNTDVTSGFASDPRTELTAWLNLKNLNLNPVSDSSNRIRPKRGMQKPVGSLALWHPAPGTAASRERGFTDRRPRRLARSTSPLQTHHILHKHTSTNHCGDGNEFPEFRVGTLMQKNCKLSPGFQKYRSEFTKTPFQAKKIFLAVAGGKGYPSHTGHASPLTPTKPCGSAHAFPKLQLDLRLCINILWWIETVRSSFN